MSLEADNEEGVETSMEDVIASNPRRLLIVAENWGAEWW